MDFATTATLVTAGYFAVGIFALIRLSDRFDESKKKVLWRFVPVIAVISGCVGTCAGLYLAYIIAFPTETFTLPVRVFRLLVAIPAGTFGGVTVFSALNLAMLLPVTAYLALFSPRKAPEAGRTDLPSDS